ncbi:MAG: DNA ligase, partial [Halomonadaceae bacterium]|nr:DNA ligase [Halomonadaceae bacterium]
MWPTISLMHSMSFALEKDAAPTETSTASPLASQLICFTGTMQKGARKDMEAHAASLGAQVQSGVNGKTTLLVAGEKAGSKLKKAEQINEKAGREVVRVLTEDEYLVLIGAA